VVHVLLIQGAGIGASDALIADMRRCMGPRDTLDAPAMPLADDPSPSRWLPAIGAALGGQSRPFVAIGHSLGGSSLLQWLGANPAPVHLHAVITAAAPFWGDGGWSSAEFALPAGARESLAEVPCLLLNGDADDTVSVDHPELYKGQLPHVATRIVPGMDHDWAGGGGILLDAARALLPD